MISSQITFPTKTFDGNFVNAKLDYGEGVKRVFNRLGMQRSYVGDEYWKKVLHHKSMQQIVPRYQFESGNIKTSNLNRFNGQSNSLYFKVRKYYGIFSKKQFDNNESYHLREFNEKYNRWKRSFDNTLASCNVIGIDRICCANELRQVNKKRPFYDGPKYSFRNRWGNVVEITDIFPLDVYRNLDAVIKLIKEKWDDAVFVGIVVKFDKNGIVKC